MTTFLLWINLPDILIFAVKLLVLLSPKSTALLVRVLRQKHIICILMYELVIHMTEPTFQ